MGNSYTSDRKYKTGDEFIMRYENDGKVYSMPVKIKRISKDIITLVYNGEAHNDVYKCLHEYILVYENGSLIAGSGTNRCSVYGSIIPEHAVNSNTYYMDKRVITNVKPQPS